MKEKIRIIYVGYHIETFLLLCSDDTFDVIGIGLIDEFQSVNTLNPVNVLFKLIYILRQRNRYRLLERILLIVWKLTSQCATSFFRRYGTMLKTLSECRTEVVNFSNKSEVIDYLTSKRVDVMVVNAWSILPEEIITLPKHGTVNIHPSKLPQYRGALPTLWSLKNGDRESAVTYLIMNKAIDAGAMIGQHTFPIHEGDDWYTIETRINETLQATFLSDLKGYITGDNKPITQDKHTQSTTGKYFEYMNIDWNTENGKAIYDKINLYPFLVPNNYCHTFLDLRKITIKKASFIKNKGDLSRLGHYHVKGRTLFIQARLATIVCTLFSGIRFKDSILFMLKKRGVFS
ncbi:MAG: hypothetical protein HXX11_11395 [Desulfuromonadales bacterium]|nr:hypothetical protein [Desulfuromonadales bacterium]